MLFVSCQVAEVLLLGCCVINRLHYHYSKSVNRPTHAQTNRNYTWNGIVIGNSSRKVSQKMVQDKMASKFTAKASMSSGAGVPGGSFQRALDTTCSTGHICTHTYYIVYYRRKFRSQTSDNIDR